MEAPANLQQSLQKDGGVQSKFVCIKTARVLTCSPLSFSVCVKNSEGIIFQQVVSNVCKLVLPSKLHTI